MAEKPKVQPILFSRERKVFFSKKSLNEDTVGIQKDEGSNKDVEQIAAIKSTNSIKDRLPRTPFPDEVEIKFNPSKFSITNPSTTFEYKRCKIQFRLKNYFSESGEILVFFIDKNYAKNPDFIELAQLCQYDVGALLTQQKLGVGKVFPLISKGYQNFQGIFLAYVDQNLNRLTLGEVLKSIFQQAQLNDIETIMIPTVKGYKDSEEMVNIYIEEIVNALTRSKKQLDHIVVTTDTPEKFKHLWKIYSDFIGKVGSFDNICMDKVKSDDKF